MSDASSPQTTAPSKPAAPRRSHARSGKAAETAIGASPRPLADILSDLQKPIPERLLEDKPRKNKKTGNTVYLTFCPWYRVQKILEHYTRGMWEYEVREKTVTGSHLLLTVRIYIHAAEGVFYREGTGLEELDVDSFGDPQSNAESMAFRRAAAKWGLGLDLYDE